MKAYGGNATVLADEFCRWFDGLWQGASLACTVAFLTLVTSLGLILVAYQVHVTAKSNARDDAT